MPSLVTRVPNEPGVIRPAASRDTETVWDCRSLRAKVAGYVPGTGTAVIRPEPMSSVLSVTVCTVVRPSVKVTPTPAAGVFAGSRVTFPLILADDRVRV